MKGFVDDIEKLTEENTDFRRVLYTASGLQLVVMAIQPGSEIGRRPTRTATSFSASKPGRARS